MKIDTSTAERRTVSHETRKENSLKKRKFFKENSANILVRICAWGIDVSVTGVLATAISKILGNNFQDPFFGPLFIYIICGFLYGTFMECSPWQATVGKHLLRLKVVRTDGKRLSPWHSAWRNLLRATVFLSVGISYLVGLIHPQRATFHDLMSSTRVIREKAPALDGVTWQPSKHWMWIPTVVFTGLSLVVVMILTTLTLSIAKMRGLVNDGYKQLSPYFAVVEKVSPDGRHYPSTVTEATRGIKDEDLLPNSGYKARYAANQGQFLVESPGLNGALLIGYLPVGHPFNETQEPAWVCIGRGKDESTERLYKLLAPATCATKPFHETMKKMSSSHR